MEAAQTDEKRLEVEELADKISGLDRESKSLLFLLSLSAFNEWQDRYLDMYRRLLELREKRRIPISEYEANLYTLLLDVQKQRTRLQNTDRLVLNQTSYLKTLWRAYRVETFIKAILIIFLLKLPYFCYFLAVAFYILYCFGVVAYVLRIAKAVRDHKSTQKIYRRLQYIISFIEPLLLVQQESEQVPEGTEENQEQETGPEPTSSSINVDEADTQPEAAHKRRWAAVAEQMEREESTEDQESSAPPPVIEKTVIYTTEPTVAPEPSDEIESDENAPEQDSSALPKEEQTAQKQKPSETEKIMYQLFGAFVLSLLPWWEPNPNYL
ncbi:hypothetical protein BEWA_032750 [Theileria equi strain WA]|uniref:Uncharacterized protein n=1 Tax=Theileria equi strain WA TaxID=1537102 RepID=L0AXY0_THEEQ|nr:hypothetical protein BEWA_032750 [Theileria equi strain WA]AFZ80422.1 hypothetical protein BEWA_032750 [Theileria equi strain WA]|eukprot:XP_004830088.1 hypothetical protein BEWA_032750 [Theileria equi strain WA]